MGCIIGSKTSEAIITDQRGARSLSRGTCRLVSQTRLGAGNYKGPVFLPLSVFFFFFLLLFPFTFYPTLFDVHLLFSFNIYLHTYKFMYTFILIFVSFISPALSSPSQYFLHQIFTHFYWVLKPFVAPSVFWDRSFVALVILHKQSSSL